MYASCPCNAAGKNTLIYYFIGIVLLASYLPLYWYRKHVEDKRDVGVPTGALPSPGD